MSSDDLQKLRKLLFEEKYAIQEINIKFDGHSSIIENENRTTVNLGSDNIINTTITLKKDGAQKIFTSIEQDVLFYASSFHRTLDKDGNWVFQCFTDNISYYGAIEQLIDKDGVKRKKALDRIAKHEFQPKYDPEKFLVKFLLSDERKNKKKFELLRQDYFEILVNQALVLKNHLEKDKKLKKERPEYAKISKAIEEILQKGFQVEENQLKNYLAYHKLIDIDIEDITKRILVEKNFHHEIYDSFARGPPRTDISVVGKVPLDVYRRYCELSSHFINALRIAIERANQPEEKNIQYKKFIKNVEIIRSKPEYAIIVQSIEPRIRHSESHINTEIDEQNAVVRITEKIKRERKVLCEYSLNQISLMVFQMERDVLPAMTLAFTIFEAYLLLRVLDSFEYRILLVGIGNIR